VVPGIHDSPFDLIPRQPIAAKLIVEQCTAFPVSHSIHIFNDECKRLDASQCSVELPIEKIDRRSPVTLSTLSVALARIAANEKFGCGEFIVLGNVATFDLP
jgi:hypothetical protein